MNEGQPGTASSTHYRDNAAKNILARGRASLAAGIPVLTACSAAAVG